MLETKADLIVELEKTDGRMRALIADLSDEQLAANPLSGHLFRLKTDIVGAPTYSFAG